MKLAQKLAIIALGAFTLMPVLAEGVANKDANVTAEEIANHSFQPISFENLTAENVKISAGNKVDYTIEPFHATDGENALKVRFTDGGNASITIAPANGKSWDFSDNRMVLAFDITNPNDRTHRLTTTIKYAGGSKAYMNSIPPQSTHTVYCVLDESLRQQGADALPSPIGFDGIIPGEGWGAMNNPSEITGITLAWSVNGPVGYYSFDNFRVVENPLYNIEETYANIVDKYGQYAPKDWANKIFSDEQLKDAQAEEEAQVAIWKAEQEARTDRTVYGGYKNEALRQEATGHFYPTKIDGAWTLIDPEGYPYFATGFGIVRKNGMDTWVQGREYMFEELPERNGEFKEHFGRASGIQPPHGQKSGTSFSFYSMNLEKKYGNDWLTDWGKMATDRFKAWGITSIGAWAEPSLFFGKGDQHKTPYTAFTWTTVNSGKHVRLYDTVPDAFDPEFEKSTIAAIKDQAVRFGIHKDPYCFGVYVDNEYKWGNNMANNPLVDAIFDDDIANEKAYAKRHFMTVFEDKYETIEALNKSWGTNFASFEEFGKPYKGDIPAADASMVVSVLSDQYYAVVDKVVTELLPGTMYLGSRNTEWGTPIEVIKSAINYVDILSFNNYNIDIQRENFKFEEYDMPMIIGEFCFSATDMGPFSPTTMAVVDQQARADAYTNYVESALKSGKFVGVHWFQYYDEPILGRSWDGENFNLGFVDVTDQPYMELVNASRELYDTMYETKFSHVPMTNIKNVQTQVTLDVGSSIALDTITSPRNLNADVSYFSTNKYVATVDDAGVVTAVGDGTATIITKNANDLFVTTSTNVTVGDTQNLDSVRFADTAKEIVLQTGTAIDLKEYLSLEGLSASDLSWKSSKKAIATVSNGIVSAHNGGRVNIVVKDKNGFATDSVNITVR
ncbi:Ig-like domain-containing protein [Candidatus Epulonipiscium viviparus]|uniref:Ig-like domain-containing protein n=1 Tax=Candidatus Epulonipiscium viviparus TaxID=420336 RepID=UPI002738069E|nr:Ig-like domain-containing protein [Candidatus Epulopiscium viviparus]